MRGFVPTPDTLVDHMVDLLFEGRTIASGERLLDPGCGTGAFMKGVLRWSAAKCSELPSMTGIELDGRLALSAASQLGSNRNIRVIEEDFLRAEVSEKYHYIIGNPPYVSILRLNEREKAEYRNRYRAATGRFDLYMLFFERALEILEPGGRLVFVTPEKFTYVDSASSLRGALSAWDVQKLEFLPEDSFGNLVTYPLITVLEKRPDRRATLVLNRKGSEKTIRLPHDGMSWGPLLNGDAPSSDSEQSVSLSTICERVSCGVATGADQVFVFERDALPAQFHQFAWPTVAGRDLNPYKDRIQTHLMMLIPYDLDGVLVPLDDLGPFGRYLKEPHIAERLMQRTCASRKPWYAFHETPYMSRILRPKILCKDIARRPVFWVDRSGTTVPRHSTYYVVPRDESILDPLCEYLNGKQARDWLVEHCQRAANGFLRTQSNVLKRLPVPSEFNAGAGDRFKPMPRAQNGYSEVSVLELVA